LEEVFVAFDGHGEVDCCLEWFVVVSGGIAEVELNIVEISDDLVDCRWTRCRKFVCEDSLDEEIV